MGGYFKSLGQERIASEDGDAFPVDLVTGGAAATKVVIVHRGEVVMDERVGVDTFDSAGQRHGVSGASTTGFCGGECQDGADALAAGKKAVAHGFVNGGGASTCGRKEPAQCAVDACGLLLHVGG